MKKLILTGQTAIEKAYVSKTPGSKKADEAACRFLPGGSTRSATDSHPYPIYMKKAEGCFLTDLDGDQYIDFMNNYTVLMLGHAHPKVNEAIAGQLPHGILFGAPSQNQYQLGQLMCERVASVEKVRFCNTGTEAVMYALRAARAVTGRNKVIKMEGGFHGNTEQVEISVSPNIALAGPAERPIPLPDTQGITDGVLQDVLVAPYNNIEATQRIIEKHKEDVAAVIIEPVMGYSGMIPADKAFLAFLREITTRYGIVLVFDEIISFRLSRGGAQETYGVRPDLTTFGKIIGGGLPIGAFGGREDIMDIFSPKRDHPMHHSGTFNGNTLTMAAGISALNEIDTDLIGDINGLGYQLRERLQHVFDRTGIRGQVTGVGSLMNVHFSTQEVRDVRTAKADWDSALPLRDLLNLALKNHGIYTPRRVMLCISSPMGEKETETVLGAFEDSLDQLKPVIQTYCPELLT